MKSARSRAPALSEKAPRAKAQRSTSCWEQDRVSDYGTVTRLEDPSDRGQVSLPGVGCPNGIQPAMHHVGGDDADTRDTIRGVLEDRGYAVVTANDGLKGLVQLSTLHFGLN